MTSTWSLTPETDSGPEFTGTAGDDTFLGYISQNPFSGGVSNTLSSADRLDGGAGYDTLFAEIVPEFFGVTGDNQIDIQPRTVSIEQVEFEARDLGQDFWSFFEDPSVTVDAKHMYGVERIGSKQSDGDLVIENLTTLANDGMTKRNTSEMTITMDHTDNTNSDGDPSDLTVLFDDNYLLAGQESEGKAFYWLLDEESDMVGGPLLDHIDVDGLRFRIGDSEIINLESDAAFEADTHEEFVAALQERLAELIAEGAAPAGTTLTLSYADSKTITLDNGTPSSAIPAIVLTSGDGSPVEPVGFSRVEDAIGEYSVHGSFTNEYEVEDQPISVDIELTKVGRGGDGGDLVVGGKSWHQGIEVFNVTVMGADHLPNSLGVLATTGGDLDTINIQSEEILGRETFASLEIRDGFGQGSLNRVDASSFYGDLALGTGNAVQNLSTLVATGGGDVTFFADIDDNSDDEAATGNYSYTTGSGDDLIGVGFSGDAVDTIGSSLTINTGSGDDVVVVELDDDGVSQETMARLGNLNIATGDGEDTVVNIGEANFYIATGADSDFVYINSNEASGSSLIGPDFGQGDWEISTVTGDPTWNERVLYQAELTVSFAGFESTVKINTQRTDNFVADQVLINETIIRAIEENPELARLLETTLGTGDQHLTIESLVEGLNSLEITIDQPEVIATGTAGSGQVVLATGDVAAVRTGLIETEVLGIDSSSNAAAVAGGVDDGNLDDTGAAGSTDFFALDNGGSGNETGVVNFSTINMGTGANDLVVLSSNHDVGGVSGGSGNTLEFTDLNMGKVSVVNFFNDDGDVGVHVLDFTAFLTDRENLTTSDSLASSTRVDTAVSAENITSGIDFAANQIAIVTGWSTGTATETWANLGASQLEAALNGATGSWSNIGAGTLTANSDQYGDLYNNVVLIENADNVGEYKAFHVVADGSDSTPDFSVSLIGVIDFGDSIDATVLVA